MREGGFYPEHGLERIVEYHERQDRRSPRPPTSCHAGSTSPLTATELAVADPDNPGPAAVRDMGRLCDASGNRAVTRWGPVPLRPVTRAARVS